MGGDYARSCRRERQTQVAMGEARRKSLSTFARIRCFEELAAKPNDWLAVGDNPAAARRRLLIAAGGHDGLISRLADFMENH
jgi:hypothetical protein